MMSLSNGQLFAIAECVSKDSSMSVPDFIKSGQGVTLKRLQRYLNTFEPAFLLGSVEKHGGDDNELFQELQQYMVNAGVDVPDEDDRSAAMKNSEAEHKLHDVVSKLPKKKAAKKKAAKKKGATRRVFKKGEGKRPDLHSRSWPEPW